MSENERSAVSLSQVHVVITRPDEQALDLETSLRERGAFVTRFPAVEITEPTKPVTTLSIDDGALFVFLSRNAVAPATEILKSTALGISQDHDFVAVGPATADAVRTAMDLDVVMPDESFTSEGLLAMSQLKEPSGRQIVIFCGENPRPLLGQTLSARGQRVCVVPVYRRAIPVVDVQSQLALWRSNRPDCVMFTSVESATNFKTMLRNSFRSNAGQIPIIVAGHRIELACRRLDYRGNCSVAESAQDADMVSALTKAVAAQLIASQ